MTARYLKGSQCSLMKLRLGRRSACSGTGGGGKQPGHVLRHALLVVWGLGLGAYVGLGAADTGSLAVAVVDATGEQVNVPVHLFDAAGNLLHSMTSARFAERPVDLLPGTYTVAITPRHRQQIVIEAGRTQTLRLGDKVLALLLDGPDQPQPWTPFDLIEPALSTPSKRPPFLSNPDRLLNRRELLQIAASEPRPVQELMELALAAANLILADPDAGGLARRWAVQTVAELGDAETIPRLKALVTGNGPIHDQAAAATGLVRLMRPTETRAFFRPVLATGDPATRLAVATAAAVESLLPAEELLRALQPLPSGRARATILDLVAWLDLPAQRLVELAEALALFTDPDLSLLYVLAQRGERRALQTLRDRLHDVALGDSVRALLIRLVDEPTELIRGGLAATPQLTAEEERRTYRTLIALGHLHQRRAAPAIGLVRRVAERTWSLPVLEQAAGVLAEQLDVTGLFRLATAPTDDPEVRNQMALALAELGVGSHLRLLQPWFSKSLEAMAAGERDDAVASLVERQAHALGRLAATSTHGADRQTVRAILESVLDSGHAMVRLVAARALLAGLQRRHREYTAPVQFALFYDYAWSADQLTLFAPLFLGLAPQAVETPDSVRFQLGRAVHTDCHEAGLIAFTCIDIQEKPQWEGPEWPVRALTLVDPAGQRHALRAADPEFRFSEEARGVLWEGWVLEVGVDYQGHPWSFAFDVERLFR